MGEMSYHERVKEIIRHHSSKVSMVNLAVTSAVAGLMYSEYLRNFKKTIRPTLKVRVPETAEVSKLLEIGSEFANEMADTMIDRMVDNHLLGERLTVPELFLFTDEYRDILKTIFEIYIIPNVSRYVPSVLRQKFGLDDPSVQTFVESSELDLFDRSFPREHHHRFIADEAVLHLLITLPELSELTECDSNLSVDLPALDEEFLSIGNQNAISMIHVNRQIIDNGPMLELLSFVTDSNFEFDRDREGGPGYNVRSNVFNQLIRGWLLPTDQLDN